MSTTLGDQQRPQDKGGRLGPSGALALMVAIPLAVWRLSRLLSHLLASQVRSYLIWPGLDEQGWHHETLVWSRKLLDILGIQLHVQGLATPGAKLVVSNHVSWLDIVAINAVVPSRFVSKAEVAHWPLVGRLVTAAGTLYLVRERRRDAMRVLGLMAQALRDGHTVAVFPEGTTGHGHEVLHFHANLLQAALDAPAPIQPVVLRYSDPYHPVSPLAAYAGDTTLIQSLWRVVTARGLCVHAQILPREDVSQGDRRALATLLQARIAQGLSNANH
jgi:1-acyl-sn-glycerol-3-phosphate acyltransferase